MPVVIGEPKFAIRATRRMSDRLVRGRDTPRGPGVRGISIALAERANREPLSLRAEAEQE